MKRKVGDKMKNIIEIKNLYRQFVTFAAVNNISFKGNCLHFLERTAQESPQQSIYNYGAGQ